MIKSKNKENRMIWIRISETEWNKMDWIVERNLVPIEFRLDTVQSKASIENETNILCDFNFDR